MALAGGKTWRLLAGSLSFGQEERMKIQQSWRSDCAPTNRDTHPMDIDKMFSTGNDSVFAPVCSAALSG